jgi:5-methylcytosine-specific restriction endonuclease McrA
MPVDRPSAAKRGYGAAWQKYRAGYLRSHPYCAQCAKQGKRSIASVVDHVSPHRGDQDKFWDKANHQALCKLCHDSYKQRLEKSGRVVGCDVTGRPIDPNHHWNRA